MVYDWAFGTAGHAKCTYVICNGMRPGIGMLEICSCGAGSEAFAAVHGFNVGTEIWRAGPDATGAAVGETPVGAAVGAAWVSVVREQVAATAMIERIKCRIGPPERGIADLEDTQLSRPSGLTGSSRGWSPRAVQFFSF